MVWAVSAAMVKVRIINPSSLGVFFQIDDDIFEIDDGIAKGLTNKITGLPI